MKHFLIVAVILSLAISCNQPVKGKNGVTYRSAVEYNDYIINRQALIREKFLNFAGALESNPDSADNLLHRYLFDLDDIIKEVTGMPSYKGDSIFRDAAVTTFKFYQRLFSNEYKEIVTIKKSGRISTALGIEELNRIIDNIKVEEEKIDRNFHDAQQDFARKNNMRLTENEEEKKFDKLNEKYRSE